MTGPFRMGVFWKRAFAALVLGRKARVDCFRTVADLLESGFELERALDVTVRAQRGQGPSFRARLLEGWRRALIENRFAEAMAASAPPAEAMIFQAYGRIEAAVLFAAAARVADLRDRQISAVRKALAMPLTLAGGLAVMLWAAGGYFVPVLESVVPPERWGPAAGLFRAASAWLHAEPLYFVPSAPPSWPQQARRWSIGPVPAGPCSTGSRRFRSTARSPARPSCSWRSSSSPPVSISTTAPSRI